MVCRYVLVPALKSVKKGFDCKSIRKNALSYSFMRQETLGTTRVMACVVSLDLLKRYEQNDKTELLEFCNNTLENADGKVASVEAKNINRIMYDICSLCVHGKISVETALSVLTDIAVLRSDLPSVLVDTLAVLDIQSQVTESHGERERYLNLLRSCCNKIVPECTIKERMEFDTLGDAGIIKFLKNTQTKFIKTKTRLFYKQQKYNLFREESEGYTKLITELNPESGDEKTAVYVLEVIKSLIGCFNLDPNRVLDIILESFECRPELYDFFIRLLQSFSCTSVTLSQVLGFKYGFYQGSSEETPSSLYRITALLLKAGLLSLNQLYGLLKPDDSRMVEKQKRDLADAHAYAKQVSAVAAEKVETNKPQTKEETAQMDEDNQKLGLCAALIDVADWEHAEQLMACFPDFYAVSHRHVALKLCRLIHVLVDSLYRQNSFSLQTKRVTKWKLDPGITVKEVAGFEELFSRVFPMLFALGPYLHIDPILISKIIRLCRQWLAERPGEIANKTAKFKAVLDLVDESFLPSLSLLECNCCMAEELWSLLKLFPYQTRYHLYSRWKTTTQSVHPLLIRTKADSLKRLKYIMKRLSKENVKPSGRHIGKLSHSNPGYLFDYILSQIQAWDNFIMPVVDSLKYLTTLSYDVLAYCIIEALANPIKERMKHDGTSISVWLQSLASFGGAVFKKYPIEISGLLQYVANQLKAGKSLDLLILKEVVQKMAGIEAVEEMTPEQVEAMSGGELLRTEGGYFNQLRNVKKSSQRLKEALLEQDLAIPLCLLMAQQRQCILYREQEQSHLKLVGKLYDHCQDTLVQFGSFLASNLNMDDYVQRVPQVSSLLTEYHIEADAAFFLVRPTFNYSIHLLFEEFKKQDKGLKNMSSSQHMQKYLDAVRSVMNPVVQSIVAVQSPKKSWDDLSPQFYVTFWALSMYDLMVPSSSYEREIAKLRTIAQAEENKDANKKKKEKERCDALISKLQEEEKSQHEHCAHVLAYLKSEKDTWFQSKAAKNETITQFLQLCIFPRCIFTPMDAIYCAKFVHLIHCLKTPNFSTLLCYDRIFLDITYTVASCSENEANRYGLFLCTMLETVMRWHKDKSIFDKECANFPGFMTKFKAAAHSTDPSASDHVDYENYRHVCHKWHFKITKALLKCLESGDFVQIRNALLVLTKVAPYFPIVTNLSQALERRIDKIRNEEKDKRPDIYALATGYSGILKNKKGSLIQESDFHMKEANRHHHHPPAPQPAPAVKQEPPAKVEKRDAESTPHRSENHRVPKAEVKSETRTASSAKPSSERPSATSQTSTSSSKSRAAHKEAEHNGIKTQKVKEERNSSDGSSPMRREDRPANPGDKAASKEEKRDRREDHHEKSSRTADAVDRESSSSHAHRRSSDLPDGEREHKRRRTEAPSTKSPRESERETRGSEKLKDEDKNGCGRDRQSSEKVHKEVDGSQEKAKTKDKDKKTNRKRDYSEDSSLEPRRRRAKTEDEPEKPRREDKSPVIYSMSQDRRSEREEKKHHRSSSVTAVKKRS